MRALVSTWKYFIIISYVFILEVVHQSTTYELKERLDCEWYCKLVQPWDGQCPVYGSCRWYCQAKLKDCTPGTRYHCARDLHNKDLFIETCAAEIFCLAGEEPQISLQQSDKASVYCRTCVRQNMYNGRHITSSAVFSECPTIKTNLCVKTGHKVDCDNTSYLELTKTDGYCRCDARNGYAAQSEKMCFYENKRCFKKKCPEGNVLSLNYTCVKECPVGFARSDESDICNKLKSPHPEIATVFTTVIEDKDTTLSTEKPPNESRPNIQIIEVVVTGASLLIAAFIVVFFVKQKKGKCLRLSPSYPGKALRRLKQEEIPLQTIKPDEEKAVVLGSHSTISSEDNWDIVTGYSVKGVPDIDTETKLASGMSVDTETKIASGKSVDTETKIAIGKSVDTETKIASGKSVDTKTKIASGKSVDTEAKIASGKSVNTETKIASGQFVDTKTKIASRKSVDTETKIASGKSAPTLPIPREAQRQVSEPKASTTATEHTTTKEVATSASVSNHAQEGADSPLRSITKWSSAMSIESDHVCKEIWQDLCNYAIGQERFPSEKFVNRIENKYFDLDSLKVIEISIDDKYFCHKITSPKVNGFTAWEKQGENSPCLYTWISHLLCGDDHMKSIIRLAAARFALQNFDTYADWITNVFVVARSLDDAKFFFTIHGVELKVNNLSEIKIGVQLAFADLVKEILNAGSGNGPFYVKFLSGALNCKIIQHYENDSISEREVKRTQCLLISFPIIDSSDRELHIFWMKSRHDTNNYRVLRLIKAK